MTDAFTLDPRTTALVLIDLQRGIVGMNVAPHKSADVVARGAELAKRFRERGATVVYVRVSYAADGADFLKQPRDFTPPSIVAPGWDELVPECGVTSRDLVVTKHQWGAFYGTELDLQLRRRGASTIVIGGISTNMGVEGTARDAFERGYALVFVEDAMAGPSTEAHAFANTTIFPRLGRVRATRQVLDAIG